MGGVTPQHGNSRRPDVLVVGAGAIGVTVAYEVAKEGLAVALVDAESAVGMKCSYGNAGLVTPSHCIPLARPGLLRRLPGWLRPGGPVHIQPRPSLELLRFGMAMVKSCRNDQMLAGLRSLRDLSRVSRDLFEEMAREGMDFGYRRDGVMNVTVTEAGLDGMRGDAELLWREGFEPEVLTPDEACAKEPLLRPTITGAVYWAEDGHCEPDRYLETVAKRAAEAGGELLLGTRVDSFRRANDGSISKVVTNAGVIEPRRVVLAAGSWTPKLARRVGTRVPVVPGKGYHIQFKDGAPRLSVPLLFHESVFGATPMAGSLRLAGTMEFVGMNQDVQPLCAARLLHEARLYLEGLDDVSTYKTWSGLRPCTPDSLPIVGESRRVGNLIFATGHAMLGLTLAPVTGRIVRDLIVSGSTDLPVHSLSPARYNA